jgi:uncharacterized protein (DUF1778 family)
MPKRQGRRDNTTMANTMLAEPSVKVATPSRARAVAPSRDSHAEVHINLRASKDDRDLIDRGAAVRHTTRTDFMLASARDAAMDALLDQSFFKLNEVQWDAFTAALDAPPKNNARLKLLLASKAPWDR